MEKIGSLFDIMNVLLGVFNGPLLACMLCAVSRLRIRGPVLIGAMGAGFLAGVGIVNFPVSPVWVTLVSSAVTMMVAWLGSLIIQPRAEPAQAQDLQPGSRLSGHHSPTLAKKPFSFSICPSSRLL